MSVTIETAAAAYAENAEDAGNSTPEDVSAEVPNEAPPEETPSADIPAQLGAGTAAEATEPEVVEPAAETVVETVVEPVAEPADDKSRTKPKRKSAPRKAAGTKSLVVLRDGRVQFADADAVLVIDLDEAASPDTDVHDVVDRLTELRDALDCPGKADAVKALTDLIQEKALG